MNSLVCVDASILIKLVVEEEQSDRASALWDSWVDDGVEIVAPTLFSYEVTATLRKKVHRQLLALAEGKEAFAAALAVEMTLMAPSGLHERAWELAARFNRPTAYDSHYLALAEMLGCEFWTADQRLFNAVRDELGWVRWLREYQPMAEPED
jgi:predicted nucleic acid-binding protein